MGIGLLHGQNTLAVCPAQQAVLVGEEEAGEVEAPLLRRVGDERRRIVEAIVAHNRHGPRDTGLIHRLREQQRLTRVAGEVDRVDVIGLDVPDQR